MEALVEYRLQIHSFLVMLILCACNNAGRTRAIALDRQAYGVGTYRNSRFDI
jgi:hypothetical protein